MEGTILKSGKIEDLVKDFKESKTDDEAKHNLLRVQVYAPIKVYYECLNYYTNNFYKKL